MARVIKSRTRRNGASGSPHPNILQQANAARVYAQLARQQTDARTTAAASPQ